LEADTDDSVPHFCVSFLHAVRLNCLPVASIGRKEAQIVRLRAELEEAQRLRVDVDELRQYCRQLEAESGRWKCRSCTFINQARNAACEMCNVPNSATTSGGGGGSGDYVAGGTSREARSYAQPSPRSGGRAQDHGIVGLPPR
jgi:hypothetical protein